MLQEMIFSILDLDERKNRRTRGNATKYKVGSGPFS
jgi:hypothetical protein